MRTVLIIIVDQLTVPDAANFARLSTRYGQPASCDIGLAPSLTETAHATLATGIDPDAHGVIGGDWMSAPGYLWSPLVADAFADGGARLFVVATKPKVAKLMIPYGQRVPARHPDRLLSTTTDSRLSGHLLVTRDGAGAQIGSHVLPGDPFAETIWADEAVIDATIDIVRNQYDAEIFSGIVVSLADVDVKGHRVPRGNARLTAHLQRIDQRIVDLIDAVDASTDAVGATLDVMVTSDHGVRPITTEVFVPPGESVAKVRSTGVPLPWPVGLRAVSFDGGSARFWFHSQASIAPAVTMLGQQPWSDVVRVPRAVGRAEHAHRGEVFAEAHGHVGLLKTTWTARGPVIAEHGTTLPDDMTVPTWATWPVGQRPMFEAATRLLSLVR